MRTPIIYKVGQIISNWGDIESAPYSHISLTFFDPRLFIQCITDVTNVFRFTASWDGYGSVTLKETCNQSYNISNIKTFFAIGQKHNATKCCISLYDPDGNRPEYGDGMYLEIAMDGCRNVEIRDISFADPGG